MKRIMEYLDKNGNVIREGDVIRFILKSTGLHVLAEAQWSGAQWVFGEFKKSDIDFKSCVIIGNIYDNWSEVE